MVLSAAFPTIDVWIGATRFGWITGRDVESTHMTMNTTTIQRLIVDLAHIQCELESGPHEDAVAWAKELRLVNNAVNALVELRDAWMTEQLD